jgi:hypothetical protein
VGQSKTPGNLALVCSRQAIESEAHRYWVSFPLFAPHGVSAPDFHFASGQISWNHQEFNPCECQKLRSSKQEYDFPMPITPTIFQCVTCTGQAYYESLIDRTRSGDRRARTFFVKIVDYIVYLNKLVPLERQNRSGGLEKKKYYGPR